MSHQTFMEHCAKNDIFNILCNAREKCLDKLKQLPESKQQEILDGMPAMLKEVFVDTRPGRGLLTEWPNNVLTWSEQQVQSYLDRERSDV
jgi:hypothetical protein